MMDLMDLLLSSAFLDVTGLLLAIILMAITMSNYWRQEKAKIRSKEEAKDIINTVKEIKTSRASIVHTLSRIDVPDTTETQTLLSDISESLKLLRGAEFDESTLISNYHSQALKQSTIQFYFSLIAGSIGLLLIIVTFITTDIANSAIVFKIVPGVIIDSVALLFFRQSEQTRERATALYDRLRSDMQRLDAVNVVTSIEDHRVRSAVRAQLALHMAGLKPSPIDLTKYLATIMDDNLESD